MILLKIGSTGSNNKINKDNEVTSPLTPPESSVKERSFSPGSLPSERKRGDSFPVLYKKGSNKDLNNNKSLSNRDIKGNKNVIEENKSDEDTSRWFSDDDVFKIEKKELNDKGEWIPEKINLENGEKLNLSDDEGAQNLKNKTMVITEENKRKDENPNLNNTEFEEESLLSKRIRENKQNPDSVTSYTITKEGLVEEDTQNNKTSINKESKEAIEESKEVDEESEEVNEESKEVDEESEEAIEKSEESDNLEKELSFDQQYEKNQEDKKALSNSEVIQKKIKSLNFKNLPEKPYQFINNKNDDDDLNMGPMDFSAQEIFNMLVKNEKPEVINSITQEQLELVWSNINEFKSGDTWTSVFNSVLDEVNQKVKNL